MEEPHEVNMDEDKPLLTSLRLLFVAAFLGQMITGAVGITVPIYANSLGATPFLLGVIGAAGGVTYSVVPLIAGMLSDRLSRKALISVSLTSQGFSCLLYRFIEEPFRLMVIKVLEWLSIAIFWPALEALIADLSTEKLDEALKKFNISWGSAMIIGPMIGGALISWSSVKAPFLLSLIIAFPFGLLILTFVKEPQKREMSTPENFEPKGNLGDYSILTILSSVFLFSSLGGIVTSLFPAYATNLGIPAYEVGLIMLASGMARTLTFYQANRIEAKLGQIRIFLAGSLTLALALLLIAYSYATTMFAASFLIFGLGEGISYSASISHILRRWGSSRGYAAGLFESLIGVGYFLGPLVGGIVSEYSPNAPYILGFLLSLAICAVQLALSMRRRR